MGALKHLFGVGSQRKTSQEDQLVLTGNNLDYVSQSAANIQQICRVRNKDIRKFLDGVYVSHRGLATEEDQVAGERQHMRYQSNACSVTTADVILCDKLGGAENRL
eukprot:TRINITY_DN99952_c0_g1_i1.p1 TRINITY_DN99952_c0_g1~~TRINITY_DN99952_c0_g1_i1.p1  ORF type:complete len:106 (+),score=8.10 TRINITY_DN99952_c0_g1_i1:2-319(+)